MNSQTKIPEPKAVHEPQLLQLSASILDTAKNIEITSNSKSKDDIIQKLTKENELLRNQLKTQELKFKTVKNTYKDNIKDLKAEISTMYAQFENNDTQDMLVDYQNVIKTLHENNVKLQTEFAGFRRISSQQPLETSQWLQTMIDYLYKHAKVGVEQAKLKQSEFKKRA